MSINGLIIKDGASAMAPTGGSDMTLSSDGVAVANGIHVSNAANADFRVRENATFKYRPPVLLADGSYTKGKWQVTYAEPKILADGKTVFNLWRHEVEVHPESSAAEALSLRMNGTQLAADSDLANFYASGSIL